jgi:hypothetical protein
MAKRFTPSFLRGVPEKLNKTNGMISAKRGGFGAQARRDMFPYPPLDGITAVLYIIFISLLFACQLRHSIPSIAYSPPSGVSQYIYPQQKWPSVPPGRRRRIMRRQRAAEGQASCMKRATGRIYCSFSKYCDAIFC